MRCVERSSKRMHPESFKKLILRFHSSSHPFLPLTLIRLLHLEYLATLQYWRTRRWLYNVYVQAHWTRKHSLWTESCSASSQNKIILEELFLSTPLSSTCTIHCLRWATMYCNENERMYSKTWEITKFCGQEIFYCFSLLKMEEIYKP
jgi:hypothetical protein